ncbi:MAG: hypothetical protein JXA77_13590, partial [Bacteroidales bacterium]|nr:hypothetical protein [Bacteroidales bacterium]
HPSASQAGVGLKTKKPGTSYLAFLCSGESAIKSLFVLFCSFTEINHKDTKKQDIIIIYM